MISYPCGVSIQLFEARIQVAEISVPSATMMVAKKCRLGPTLLQPNSATPRNPASRKKAVSTAYASGGPGTPPRKAQKKVPVEPSLQPRTHPATNPQSKVTAK